MRYHSFFPGLGTDQIRLLKKKIGGYHFSLNTFLYNVFQYNSMSWSMCRLEKNFQTWGRMRRKWSLLEWEVLLEQQPSSRENQRWTGVLSSLLYPGHKEWIGIFRVICWLDEARILRGRRGRQGCPYGPGGQTGYTAQEDLKSVNSYNMGEGRKIKSGFSVLASQDPPWFYLLFHPWITTSNTGKWIVRGEIHTDKAKDFTAKGTGTDSSKASEPRRRGLQPQGLR